MSANLINTPCGCKLRCYDNVPAAERQKIFDGFWATASFDVQNTYLCGCVHLKEVSQRYTDGGSQSRRQRTRQFYVKCGSIPARVCKVAFLRIHSVSNGRLDRALSATEATGESPHTDQRGRHPPWNKTPQEMIESIKAHM